MCCFDPSDVHHDFVCALNASRVFYDALHAAHAYSLNLVTDQNLIQKMTHEPLFESKSFALSTVQSLLIQKPEQEHLLLTLLVNRLVCKCKCVCVCVANSYFMCCYDMSKWYPVIFKYRIWYVVFVCLCSPMHA